MKIIEGPYNQVVNELMPDVFKENSSSSRSTEKIKEDAIESSGRIKKDLPRTPYFAKDLTVSQITTRLEKEFEETQNKVKTHFYEQADFDARIARKILMARVGVRGGDSYEGLQSITSMPQTHVCYVDDDNVLCGLYMFIQKNPQNPEEFIYGLAISKNVTDTVENRKYMLIADKLFIDDSSMNNIGSADILPAIQKTLNSADLFEAIKIVIHHLDVGSKTAFEYFSSRIVANQNCYPNIQAFNLGASEYNTVIEPILWSKHNKAIEQALQPKKEAELKRSIFSRNRAAIAGLFSAVALGAGVAVGVVLFVSPLGLLTIPLVLGAVALAGVAVAAMGIFSALKFWGHERSLKQYKIARALKIKEADDKLNTALASIKTETMEEDNDVVSATTVDWDAASTLAWTAEKTSVRSHSSMTEAKSSQSLSEDRFFTHRSSSDKLSPVDPEDAENKSPPSPCKGSE